MSDEELNTLQTLRSRGYALVIWTPEELGDADPRRVEDRCIEIGHEIIEYLTQ